MPFIVVSVYTILLSYYKEKRDRLEGQLWLQMIPSIQYRSVMVTQNKTS